VTMLLLNSIDAFRQFVTADRTLIEPVRHDDGVLRWTESSVDQTWSNIDGVPLSSLKPYFFPERQSVFVFDGAQFRSCIPTVPPRVFFGIKACDAAALAIQDRFFADDEFYQARRQSALIVAVDCIKPCSGGFCPLTQSGPLVQAGADLVLTPYEENWLLHAMTPKGEIIIAEFQASIAGQSSTRQDQPCNITAEVKPDLQAIRKTLGEACSAAFGNLDELARGLSQLQSGTIAAAEWETLAIQCLSCSGCVNLCPSCSCFTTFDTPHPEGIVREQVWDACLYDGFQREASGHNPSLTPGARTARYWFHKFSAEFIPQQGRLGCTGCGRCDAVCPGVIGAKTVLTRIALYET
jgi:sulfhydrogenase subunit beta (sulfur reductase)